jgi:signal transduction histidine kinase
MVAMSERVPQLPAGAKRAAYVAVAAFVLAGLGMRLPEYPVAASLVTVVTLAVAALLLRVGPALVGPVVAATGAGVALLGTGEPSNVGWFAACLLAGWCALAGARRAALLYVAGLVVVLAAEQLWATSDPGWLAWGVGTACMVAAGLLVRHQLVLVAELRIAQAGLADRARAEERNRIARELHDVIAHSLTVSLLHIASARMAVRFDPDDAERALAEAERLGRETLDEVRSTVGLLRADGRDRRDDPAAPLPGMDGVPTLVERFRAAGADVTLDLDGDPGRVPATVGLAVYRIVQEALTNAAKHAPGAPVTVQVSVGPAVAIRVASAGRPRSGAGLGLDSMRERAETLGGTLRAAAEEPGWVVAAELPLPAGRRREVSP